MSKLDNNGWLLSDDGRKRVGWKHPDGTDSGIFYATETIISNSTEDSYAKIIAALGRLKSAGGGALYLPYIDGVGYKVSNKILVDFDNCAILLDDNLSYTGTTAIDAVIHFKGVISPAADYIENPALIATRRVTIDANGRNLSGYVHPAPGEAGTMYAVFFQFCKNIRAKNLYCYNGIAGGFITQYCLGGRVDDIDVSDVYYDNGMTIYQNGDHYGLPSDTDPSTWSNILAVNCRAWNCANHGLGIYGAVGVTYMNPKIWGCGNNTVNGPDGFARAAGPAGGMGVEYDSSGDTSGARNYRFTAINLQVTGSYGFGFRTNCKGTVVRGGFIKGTKIPTNHTDSSPTIWGTGVFVQTFADAVIDIDISGSERYGIRVQGSTTDSPKLKYSGTVETTVYKALYAIGFEDITIDSSSIFKNNGSVAGGEHTIDLNNGVPSYNLNGGTSVISGVFYSNGGQVLNATNVGNLTVTNVTGHNNLANLASAYHAIYIQTGNILKLSDINLTSSNSKQARVVKVDSCTTAVVDRQSILGQQTSTSQPLAQVVATTLIGDLFTTAAPATTPNYYGQKCIDTTNGKMYFAKGMANAADWIILN